MTQEKQGSSGCGIALIIILIGGIVCFGLLVGMCGLKLY